MCIRARLTWLMVLGTLAVTVPLRADAWLDVQPATGVTAPGYTALTNSNRWDNGTQVALGGGAQAGWVDVFGGGTRDRGAAYPPLTADFVQLTTSQAAETLRIIGLDSGSYALTLHASDPAFPDKKTLFTIDQDNDGTSDHSVSIDSAAGQNQATIAVDVSVAGILAITFNHGAATGVFNGLELIGGGSDNLAPTVDAGPDREITLPAAATLDGTVSDDGLPNPPGAMTTTWSKVSGPGTVTFANAGAVDTTATFGAAGTYMLQLLAYDGARSASDSVTITVNPSPLVLEVDTTADRGTFMHTFNVRVNFVPKKPWSGYRASVPFIEHYSLFNAFGCFPGRPEVELYDEDAEGNPVYHFDRLAVVIDEILAQGMKPYLTVGGCPVKLARNPGAVSSEFGTITCAPSDYDKYRAFVQAFFEDLNSRYGAQNVAGWRFKMMTEPDNVDWWSESREEWFKFYDYTVSGARAANPDVVINPGNLMRHAPNSYNLWLVPWAQRVHNGTFAVPGEQPVMPRRITFSFYSPWQMPNAGGPHLLYQDIPAIRQALAPFPEFDNIPIGVDEGYIGMDEWGRQFAGQMDGTEFGAAHTLLLTQAGMDAGLDSMALWDCESNNPPMGTRMVLDWVDGVNLQTRLSPQVISGSMLTDHHLGALAARDTDGIITVMVSHWARYRNATGTATYSIRLTHLPPGTVDVHHARIDRDHGIFAHQWISDSASIPRPAGWSLYGCYPFAWGLESDPAAMAIWNANRAIYWGMVNSSDLGTSSQTVGPDGVLTLTVTMSPQSASKFEIIPVPGPIPGDVDGDGHVDVVDLLYLVDSFGRTIGEPGFDPACDFNRDDSVDVIDLLTMVENWGI